MTLKKLLSSFVVATAGPLGGSGESTQRMIGGLMIGTQPVGTISGVVISAVSHEGISVTVDGKAARLAILTDDGRVIAAGNQVAKEVEAVALNSYRNFLKGQGFLRVHSKRSFNRDLASDADLSL